MARDALGLEWNRKKGKTADNNPDNGLYTAMIWALSIGIVIVVITLILTRPVPESFSELYFNNHTALPEYVKLNQSYPYSFTIHNLENKNITYNYTISTEYYNLDYSCEKPELYLEPSSNNSRITETNDPALYIKDPEYAIGFNYEMKDGLGRIAFKIVDISDSVKYQVVIDQKRSKVYVMTKNNVTAADITGNTTLHTFKMLVTKNTTTFFIDTQSFKVQTPKDYTGGFIQLETIDTYAEFTNFLIDRRTVKMPVYIRLADSQYTAYKVDNVNNSIVTDNPINLTNYNVQAVFRPYASKDITLSLRNSTEITYFPEPSIIFVIDSGKIDKYYVDAPVNGNNDLLAKVSKGSIGIYFNGKFVASLDNTNTVITPSITYNNVTVSDFTVKSNDAPITIDYDITAPAEETSGLLTVDSLKYFKDDTIINSSNASKTMPSIDNITRGLNEAEKSSLEEYYERTKIDYTDYKITAVYTDKSRNDTFSVAMAGINGTVYAVDIYDKAGSAKITYIENKTIYYAYPDIIPSTTNRLTIDVKNSTLTVILNNKNIFMQKIERYNDGVVLFDYGDVTLALAQIENRKTGSVRIFQKQLNLNCEPILLNKYIQSGSVTIADKDMKIIKNNVKFNSTFDIAKVQVSLENGQEIHFWTKLI